MNIERIQTYRPMDLALDIESPGARQEESRRPEPQAPPAQDSGGSAVIQFSEDQVSGKMRMQVVDPESGEVVRQIPPEDLVAISRMLGILFDRVA